MKIEHDKEMNFGKYKGQMLSNVMRIDPGYIIWAVDNIEWFKVDDDIYEEALARKEASTIRHSYHRSFGRFGDHDDDDRDYMDACIGYEH